MSNIQRSLQLFLLLCCVAPWASAADNAEFAGSWIAWVCPASAQPDSGKCSSLVLALFQKQGKLCGSHVFATAGASAMDEGGAPSLLGTIAGETATVTVESGRSPGVRVEAELTAVKGALKWRRLNNPKGDYLLPVSATLTRSRHGKLFSPLFEQKLNAACTANLNKPADTAPEPIPLPAEQAPQPVRPAS